MQMRLCENIYVCAPSSTGGQCNMLFWLQNTIKHPPLLVSSHHNLTYLQFNYLLFQEISESSQR